MDIKTMTSAELEERRAQLAIDCEAEGADVDALLEEVRAINAEIEERKQAQQAELRAVVAAGAGTVIEAITKETRTMDNMEIRNSAEYIDAFANYIKTGKDTECRALLSINAVSGTVPVPTFVSEIVAAAWERDEITRLVKKTYLRGNLKVGFEVSGSDATVHTEGSGGVAEEDLVLGVVDLTPTSIKKWVSISDEVLDLNGENFLRYIYDELTYKIAQKAADTLLAQIIACGTVSTTTQVAVPVYTSTTVSVSLASQALGLLKGTRNEAIVMARSTWSALKKAQADNKFNYDPFEGREVLFSEYLPSFSAATTGETYMIVGDFAGGAQFNFPNGDDINFKFDDITLATSDLVKVIGRQFVGIGVVKPYAFAKVVK